MKRLPVLLLCAWIIAAGSSCDKANSTSERISVSQSFDDEMESTREFPLVGIQVGRSDYLAETLNREFGRSAQSLSELEIRAILLEVIRAPNNAYLTLLFEYLDLGSTVPPAGSWQEEEGHSLTSLYVQHGFHIGNYEDHVGRLLRIAAVDPSLDEPDKCGLRAIDHAVSRGYWEAVVMLQTIGAQPPSWSLVNVGILSEAIIASDVEEVYRLLRRPIDPSAEFLPWQNCNSVVAMIDWLLQELDPRALDRRKLLVEVRELILARAIHPEEWRSNALRVRANDEPWQTDNQSDAGLSSPPTTQK